MQRTTERLGVVAKLAGVDGLDGGFGFLFRWPCGVSGEAPTNCDGIEAWACAGRLRERRGVAEGNLFTL